MTPPDVLMGPARPARWVGREQELAILSAATQALARGEGTVVWVEGEPGIGKSSLVAEALAAGAQPGWDLGWGEADQLTRLPLRVMQDCLRVRSSSADPRRAHAADLLRSQQQALSGGDASANGIEVLLTLADDLGAAAPTVLVLDDLQWADEASLTVWHQLASSISQLRLLLIGTCRPVPRSPEVLQARTSMVRRGGRLVSLGPLAETDVATMVTGIIGASSTTCGPAATAPSPSGSRPSGWPAPAGNSPHRTARPRSRRSPSGGASPAQRTSAAGSRRDTTSRPAAGGNCTTRQRPVAQVRSQPEHPRKVTLMNGFAHPDPRPCPPAGGSPGAG